MVYWAHQQLIPGEHYVGSTVQLSLFAARYSLWGCLWLRHPRFGTN